MVYKYIQKKKHKKSGGNIFKAVELCCVSPSSAIIHKTVFSDLGYFDEELLACEDYDFWLRYRYQTNFTSLKATSDKKW
ncbi:MAG: hypothetical protein CM15mP117_12900 [Alphaproteobacteria bacterium]|nr:MAG: hypothetical protein CM15mP117_12900 [Alphaproteobacteria bacterium]